MAAMGREGDGVIYAIAVIADGDILDSVSIKVSCFKSDRFAANLG